MWQSLSYYAVLVIESVVGVFGIRLYEEPSYTVVARLNDAVEIRRYAPRVAAEVALDQGGEQARSAAFQALFDYITGENKGPAGADKIAMTVPVSVHDPERVAMTAPVETSETDGKMRMRFFLPAKYDADTAPEPLDKRVEITRVPEETIATLRYSGIGREFKERETGLLDVLKDSEWQPVGEPFTLYYDAPFTLPFLRRNEAAVRVGKRP